MDKFTKSAIKTGASVVLAGAGVIGTIDANRAATAFHDASVEQKTLEISGQGSAETPEQIVMLDKKKTWAEIIEGLGVATALAGAGLAAKYGKQAWKHGRDEDNGGNGGPGGDEPPSPPTTPRFGKSVPASVGGGDISRN